MRIMLDTNVLISALLFPGAKMNSMMETLFTKHDLVLSSYVVDELKDVIAVILGMIQLHLRMKYQRQVIIHQ